MGFGIKRRTWNESVREQGVENVWTHGDEIIYGKLEKIA
jgi:hypothetical protein